MPKALSQKEIYELIQAYAEAAGRAKEAGADGVEIHMAHGYLLNQFRRLHGCRIYYYLVRANLQ